MFGLEDGAAQTKDGTAATLSDLGPSSLRPRLRPDRRGSRKALDQRGLIQPEVRSSVRGQRLTGESGFDSRLPFGGSFGRTDRSDG